MDDKAKESEGTRDFIFFFFLREENNNKKTHTHKNLSLASEGHIANRVGPNLAGFNHRGAHQG